MTSEHVVDKPYRAAVFLVLESKDGGEQANREMRLAIDLPPSVIARRAAAAEAVANANGVPDRAQLAALIARLMGTVSSIQAVIERRTSGASLQ